MPPRLKNPAQKSVARDVVPTGPRQVFKNSANKKPDDREKPSTTKALVLRNGKYGAMGTGELVLASKLGGREKLDLLSEDYVKKAASAVRSPFQLTECVKIAESQLDAYLDEISNLQDPTSFCNKIKEEAKARAPPSRRPNAPDPMKNSSFTASIVANRIHNMYMLASAWNLVRETLFKLDQAGLEDRSVKAQLKNDDDIRSSFLVLHDIVNVLVDTGRANFAVLTTTTSHYAEYFKQSDDIDEPEFSFDWTSLKNMHKSFLDSIIIELCLPNSQIPKQIMFQILHEAVEEAPRETKRFPQALWDAVGDFAITVQLQEILEGPLLGPEGQSLKGLPRTMPEEYEQWIDAQLFSARASQKYANFKEVIFPLEKAQDKQVLETMWRFVNLNYKTVSGEDIDSLWSLSEIRERTPQWHAYYVSSLNPKSESASKGKGSKKRLAITNGDPDDSDGSMPSLQTVSESTEAEDDDSDDSEHYSNYGSDHDESEWDTDEDEGLKDMLREAMNVAMAIPDFTDGKTPVPEFDALAEERKDNPFLKLLGSLRGRMFSSNPILKTASRNQPRRPYADASASTATKKPHTKSATQSVPKSQKATVEDVEDEDDVATSPSKKKKKKKPKKKKRTSSIASDSTDQLTEEARAVSPTAQASEPPTSPVPPSFTKSPKAKKTAAPPQSPSKVRIPSFSSTTTLSHSIDSTTSLPLPAEQTAKSAHAYIQSEGLSSQKSKVKSRPDFGNLGPVPEKRGFFSKFGKKKDEEEEDIETPKGTKQSWFAKLGKKTTGHMRQLIGADDRKVAPMKWDNFLRVMREMGFQYDPSTAGSSVRFDPPDSRDRSITFHKPHPDSTLSPHKLKDFGKRLKTYYGWSEDDFYKALDA